MPRKEDDDLDVVKGLSATRDETGVAPDAGKAQDTSQAAEKNTQAATKGDNRAQASEPLAAKASPAAPQKAHRAGFVLTFVLLLGLAGASGWMGQQIFALQGQLEENARALQLERSRMDSISAQVFETGSNFEETGNVLASKFEFFDSEIRKLWDVSNKRNKQAIQGNKARISALQSTMDEDHRALRGKLADVSASQAETSDAVTQVNKRLAAENTALRASLEEQSEQLLTLRSQLELLNQRVNDLPGDMAARVAKHDEAISAIDASRRQLVTRLTQLQQRVDDLWRQQNP